MIESDEAQIKDHVTEVVRGSVENTLNALLDAEAGRLCNAARYERTEARRDTRAGSYCKLPRQVDSSKVEFSRLRCA